MSRSGSIDSSVISWAMTSFADASSICTPRKTIRSSKSLLYGFISLMPYEVRSTKDGRTYRASAWRGSAWRTSAGRRLDVLTVAPPLPVPGSRDRSCCRHLDGAADDAVHEAVLPGFLGG